MQLVVNETPLVIEFIEDLDLAKTMIELPSFNFLFIRTLQVVSPEEV